MAPSRTLKGTDSVVAIGVRLWPHGRDNCPPSAPLYSACYDRGGIDWEAKRRRKPIGTRSYSPSEGLSGRNHKETCAGCIFSLTTPTSSLLNASKSVSSRSLAEKASSVLLASYFLR